MADPTGNHDIQPEEPMETHSTDPHDQIVRQRLADLPRLVMPDEVRARLDAAIAGEALAGRAIVVPAAPVPGATVPQQTAPTVVGLPAPRQRRTSIGLSLIGVAAAFVMFAAVDPFATAPPPAQDLLADQTAEPESTKSSGAEPGTAALAPSTSEIAAVTTASGMQYTQAGIASQVQVVLAEPRSSAPADLTSVSACVLGLGPSEVVLVDQAEFEGQPALIVARQANAETLTVTVHRATCSAENPAVLATATVEWPTRTPSSSGE